MTGSGASTMSSIQTVPFPPVPAVMAISIAADSFRSPPPLGPHAKEMCRFLSVTFDHCVGKTKSRRFTHQTLSPEASTSLNSRLLVGALPWIQKLIS
jgi:hypothetical protein